MGLRLSEAKTRVVHMSEGLDFLGFRIQWTPQAGHEQVVRLHLHRQRPVRSLKAKIRALTRRTSQQDLEYVLAKLNQVMHGWAWFFRHAVAKHTFSMLDHFTWRRLVRMLKRAASLETGRSSAGRHITPTGGGCRSAADRSSYAPSTRSPSPGTAARQSKSPAPGHC